MKVKLLKKIRKRYSITYYPTGVENNGWIKGPLCVLSDHNNLFQYRYIFGEKSISYKHSWDLMREWIRKDYKTEKKRRTYTSEKLWFNGK
jgi:hypothetical protein